MTRALIVLSIQLFVVFEHLLSLTLYSLMRSTWVSLMMIVMLEWMSIHSWINLIFLIKFECWTEKCRRSIKIFFKCPKVRVGPTRLPRVVTSVSYLRVSIRIASVVTWASFKHSRVESSCATTANCSYLRRIHMAMVLHFALLLKHCIFHYSHFFD